jgi:hypothetical protein
MLDGSEEPKASWEGVGVELNLDGPTPSITPMRVMGAFPNRKYLATTACKCLRSAKASQAAAEFDDADALSPMVVAVVDADAFGRPVDVAEDATG